MRRVALLIALLALVPTLVGFGLPGRGGHRLARVVQPGPLDRGRAERRAHRAALARWQRQLTRAALLPPAILPFAWPAKGSITGVYGWDAGRRHPGIDIGVLRSLTVRAAAPGRVLDAGYTPGFDGYGKVVVERVGRYTVLYAHLSRVRVHPGERVPRGERIGVAGCTGWCTGTHVHFEVRRGHRTVDPMRMLAKAR